MKWLWAALAAIPGVVAASTPDILWQFGSLTGVPCAIYSPDGQTIVAGGWDETIKVYHASDGRLQHTMTGHTYIVADIQFSPDGSMLASAGRDFKLKIWRTSDWQLLRTIDLPYHLTSVAWSPDGTKVATGCQDNNVRTHRASDGVLVRTLPFPSSSPEKVAYSPNGAILAASGGDTQGRIVFWNPDTGAVIRTLLPNSNYMRDIAFSPDGNTLASANGYTNVAQLWNVSTGANIGTLTGHTGPVWSVQYSHNGNLLATGSGNSEQNVRLWSMPAGTLLTTFPIHPYWVMSTEFSPNDATLIVGSYDVHAWSTTGGFPLQQIIAGNSENYPAVKFFPSGSSIATSVSSSNSRVAIWNANTGAFERNLPGDREEVVISPNELFYASCLTGPDVPIRLLSDGSVHRTLVGHTEQVRDVAFSSGSQYVATCGGYYFDLKGTPIIRDCNARLWRMSDGGLLRTLTGHNRVIVGIAISPDTTRVASCGDDALKLWNFDTGAIVQNTPGSYTHVEFSPDGAFVAGSRLNVIDLFDGHTGALIRTLTGLPGNVSAIAFSPTGNVIAGGLNDYNILPTIRFWRTTTGASLHVFDTEVGTGIYSIAFSNDGSRFVYTRSDTAIVMAANPFAPITVLPTTFTVSPGIVRAGGLAQILVSDDLRVYMRPGAVLTSTAPPIRMVLEGTSPIATVGDLRISVEGRASSANVRQNVELFDFVAAQYVQVDSRKLATIDSVTVSTAQNPSRFVEVGTRKVRARISWKAEGPVLTFPWTAELDHVFWSTTP